MIATLLELAGVAAAAVGAAFLWGPWAIALVVGSWVAWSAGQS
jgi:hypothetical protein